MLPHGQQGFSAAMLWIAPDLHSFRASAGQTGGTYWIVGHGGRLLL